MSNEVQSRLEKLRYLDRVYVNFDKGKVLIFEDETKVKLQKVMELDDFKKIFFPNLLLFLRWWM